MDDLNEKLIEAAEFGDLDKVKLLIERGASIHFENEYGSVLDQACFYGQDETVRYLIEQGVNVNYQDSFGGTVLMTVLDANLDDGHIAKICEILVKSGADPLLKDKEGRSAFIVAKDMQLDACVELFQSYSDNKTLEGVISTDCKTSNLKF